MRPHDKGARSVSKGAHRARHFIARDLAWLEGYPVPGQVPTWQVSPWVGGTDEREMVLTGTDLSKATYTLQKLVLRFPRALPRVVESPKTWEARTRQQLERLKPWIHQGVAPPPSLLEEPGAYRRSEVAQAVALRGAHSRLAPLIDALSWTQYVTGTFAGVLPWLEAHAQLLGSLLAHRPEGLAIALRCLRLSRDGDPTALRTLMGWLADPTLDDLRGGSGLRQAEVERIRATAKKRRAWEPVELRPADPCVPGLAAWTLGLANGPRRHVPLALEALHRVLPLPLARAWQRWWVDVSGCGAQLDVLFGRLAVAPTEPERQHLVGHIQRQADHLEATINAVPATLPLSPLESITQLARAPWAASALGVIAAAPEAEDGLHGPGGALRSILSAHADSDPTTFGVRLGRVHEAIESAPEAQRWSPWSEELWVLGELVDGDLSANQESFFLALQALLQRGPVDPDDASLLLRLSAHESDPERLAALQLSAGDNDLPWSGAAAIQLGLLLFRDEPERCWAVVAGLSQDNSRDPVAELSLARALVAADRRDLAHAGFLDELGRMRRLAGRWAQRRGQVVEPPVRLAPVVPEWASSYPDPLHAGIAAVAVAHPDARGRVRRLLEDDLPNVEGMRRELQTLESLIEQPGAPDPLRRRAQALRARIEAPRPLSGSRIKLLNERLHRGALRAELDRFESDLDAAFARSFLEWSGLQTLPSWALDPDVGGALSALQTAAQSVREVARLVLRARTGPAPWDLRSHPANLAFIERCEASGVRMAPWLDGAAPMHRGGLVLALEADPIEVLPMGEHFETCLSFEGVNFFSVISTTADINKRVLYARDGDAVVGRVLLALTSTGALLTFHVYCHRERAPFLALVKAFVVELAQQMGVPVVPSGEVETLVSSDWYDDGPLDLTGDFRALDSLPWREMTEPALVGRLRGALSPHELDARTLPMILAVPAFDLRPTLARPLLPLVAASRFLPLETVARAAHLAREAGEEGMARTLVTERVLPALARRSEDTCWDDEILSLLAHFHPSALLGMQRRERRTLPRARRQFVDCQQLYWRGRALEQLHRRGTAVATYQEAVDSCGANCHASNQAAERLTTLGARLPPP
jgi:hypothetical protein